MSNTSFVSFVDRLEYKPRLFINRQERDISCIGACTTLLVGALIFAIILFYFIEFLTGSGMTVVSSKDNVTQPIMFDLSNRVFMFRFMDRFGNKVDPRIAYLYAVHWSYSQGNLNYVDLSIEQCKNGKHFHQDEYSNFLENNSISDYLCIHADSNKTLSYDNMNTMGSYIIRIVMKR